MFHFLGDVKAFAYQGLRRIGDARYSLMTDPIAKC